MMKKIFVFLSVFALVLATSPVSAQKPDLSDKGNSAKQVFKLPANAIEVAPGVFSLGSALDPQTGKVVEGYAYVHYKQDPARPDHAAKPAKPNRISPCYGFLAKGAKWKGAPEPWVVNAAGSDLGSSFVLNNLGYDISKWEDAASHDILGSGQTVTYNPSVDYGKLNNKNEVYFAPIADHNTIAVTIIWGIFGGPISGRKLVEWDQVYNTVFPWSSSGEANKMDFENIATHELGHSVGLDDLYTQSCSQQTMYGYASEGETNKQTLESGDVAGVQMLYQ